MSFINVTSLPFAENILLLCIFRLTSKFHFFGEKKNSKKADKNALCSLWFDWFLVLI